LCTPYSLGKLIEWKQLISPNGSQIVEYTYTPYSLGKLIEWKLASKINKDFPLIRAPYSLGKLIEWKLCIGHTEPEVPLPIAPYSLGKLIEWKRTQE
jgi:hypothetical protein